MACLLHDHLWSLITKKSTRLRTFKMHSDMAEDENFNTLCIGRVIHTPTTPGLITRTYMPQTHWQTSCWQTLLQLDDLQYKETTRNLQTILIPTSLWLSNTLQHLLLSTAPSVSTIQTHFLPSIYRMTVWPSSPCPAHPLPSSFHLALHPLLTVPATPPTLSPLPFQTALLAMN